VLTSPPGLDLDAIRRFLDPHVGGLTDGLSAEVIKGGRSNLTYVVRDGERRWVVRRPPLAHVLPTAHDMAREWRVISALQKTDIPVPGAVAFCADESVVGAPFYVMEYIDGHVVRDRLPRDFPRNATTRADMSAALVDTLVRLHAIDPEEVGLGDFGRPEGFLERQVRRWWQQWEASKTRELPAIEELHRRLEASIPEQSAAGIVHGDYRLDNVVFAPDDPSRVVAILDWEMSTVGDPLCDLGLLIVYWPDTADDPAVTALHAGGLCLDDGFYSRATIIHEYQVDSRRDLRSLEWYIALGYYKLAIIAEGIAMRHQMGMTVGDGFETMGQMVPPIVEGALERARRSGIAGLAGA
jgi:aminoglycoside phosphotransferase (APT) family kinase protein